MDLLQWRLATQHVTGPKLADPADVVRLLCAVQSQDYGGAKWSLGMRTEGATDSAIDAAFDRGEILRTHVLRPTWHFVAPEDIRWLQALTGPRVHALNAYICRQCNLDAKVLGGAHRAMADALSGGVALTRAELATVLGRSGIQAEKLRLAYIVMHAELEGLICSGPRSGAQHTYMLLEERAAPAPILDRPEALATLARRFFTGHGPATVKHMAWWSGLTIRDCNAGLDAVRDELTATKVDGSEFWSAGSRPRWEAAVGYDGRSGGSAGDAAESAAHLIPEYDESLVGSKDLGVADFPVAFPEVEWSDRYYRPVIVDGKRAGTWRRTHGTRSTELHLNLFARLSSQQMSLVRAEADALGRYLERPIELTGYEI